MSVDRNRPFTRAAALGGGISAAALAGRSYQRLFHGLYIGAEVQIAVEHQARAALSVAAPGSYASHHTAVRLWGGWAPPSTDTHISVPPRTSRSERRGIAAHRGSDVAPAKRRGIPVSSPADAFLELAAAGANLVDLVAVGDSLVKAKVITPRQLVAKARLPNGLAVDGLDARRRTYVRGSIR